MLSNTLQENINYADASQLQEDTEYDADVLVVGSGAGGGFAAKILAEAGFRVMIVEEGPLKTAKDFNMLEREAYPELYQELASRQTLDNAITILQGRCVGGSTTVNWTSSFRVSTSILDHWQQQFGLSGLSDAEMAPWYQQVEQYLSIKPWALPANANNQVLADGAQKLSWAWGIIPRNVKNCADIGACGLGCPIDAKQSTLVSAVPDALANQARLLTRARISHLNIQNKKIIRASGRAINTRGHERNIKIHITAKHVVLAAGAIGSPAILLRSKAPDPYHRLGKRTFLHPVNVSVAFMAERIDGFRGAPQSIYSDQFLFRDGIDGKVGFKLEVPPLHPVIMATNSFEMGKAHQNLMHELPNLQATLALMRDGFHPESEGGQVRLDKHQYPKLDYPINAYLEEGFREAYLRMAELQFAAGAKRVMPLHNAAKFCQKWPEVKRHINSLTMTGLQARLFSAHVMGGCGMSASAELGVVNEYGQHHQVNNLSVIDGSILPSSLGVNPQLTLFALAQRAATYLAKELKNL